jgi:hypothetical protein
MQSEFTSRPPYLDATALIGGAETNTRVFQFISFTQQIHSKYTAKYTFIFGLGFQCSVVLRLDTSTPLHTTTPPHTMSDTYDTNFYRFHNEEVKVFPGGIDQEQHDYSDLYVQLSKGFRHKV